MKKLLFAMFAFALCLGITSCKEEAGKAKDGDKKEVNDKKERAEITADSEKASKSSFSGASMAEIVAEAKANGDSWSVDEWKEQYKNMLKAAKPMMDDMMNLRKRAESVEGDKSKEAEIVSELMAAMTKYEKDFQLMEEFGEIAEKSANGKKVMDDEDFGKEMMEEFGFDEFEDQFDEDFDEDIFED